MNTSTFIIGIDCKNFGKSMRMRAGIFSFSFIMFCALFLFNFPALHMQPLLFNLQPSLVWAQTSGSGSSVLPNNKSGRLSTGTIEHSYPEDADLLQKKLMEQTPQTPYQSGNFASYMLKASFSLVVVLVIILSVSYLLKKYYLKGNLFGGKFIHLLDTCRLGPKKSLVLTQVENQTLLLGITGQQITLLSQISLSEKSLSQKIKSDVSNRENFAEQLSENSIKLQQNQSKDSAATIAGILQDRFRGLKKI